MPGGNGGAVAKQAKPQSFIPDEVEFRDLVARANYGDGEARVKLKQLLDQHPLIWQVASDINRHVQDDFIKQIAGADLLLTEALCRQLEQRKKKLLRNPDSGVEELAVERVLACELELEFLASKYPDTPDVTKDRAAVLLRCKESAERRLVARRIRSAPRALFFDRQIQPSTQLDQRRGTNAVAALATLRHQPEPRLQDLGRLQVLFAPDEKDPGITEWYGMVGFQVRGDLLVAFLQVLRDDLTCEGAPREASAANPTRSGGMGHTVLCWSRDGETWQRDRQVDAFLEPNPKIGWDHAIPESQTIARLRGTP